MNRDYVLWHLREAAEELNRVIQDMTADPEYVRGELEVGITHLYHHLNTAWNARDSSAEQVMVGSADDFRAWRQFPSDLLGIK